MRTVDYMNTFLVIIDNEVEPGGFKIELSYHLSPLFPRVLSLMKMSILAHVP